VQALQTAGQGMKSQLRLERVLTRIVDEVSEARVRAGGLFQVPVIPEWQRLVGFGSRALVPVGD